MARIYHEKKLSEKILEGVIAGLVGGAVVALLVLLWDFARQNGNWRHTFGEIGTLITNAQGLRSPIGLLIHFLLYALIGYSFYQYKPIFRRFNISLVAGGAIFGLIVGLLVYVLFFGLARPIMRDWLDGLILILINAVGGAAMGWWLARPQGAPTPQPEDTMQAEASTAEAAKRTAEE